jgi:glycosyltransferase involved in cell wall biosynthesis
MEAGPPDVERPQAPLVATLTVFFPMWNEQDYIYATVDAARDVCRHMVAEGEIGDFEVLIVDDASTDATGSIADSLAAEDSHVRVVHHPVNRKLGGSIKTGFAHARGDLVLYTDADLPCDLAELRKACRLLRYYGADVVSAYRHDRTGEGPRRMVYSWLYNWLVTLLFGVHIRDVNFAFKLCQRRIFDKLELTSEGSFIDAELLIKAQALGYRVIQFGVDYFPRSVGVSTLSSAPVIVDILREMLAQARQLRELRSAGKGGPSGSTAP